MDLAGVAADLRRRADLALLQVPGPGLSAATLAPADELRVSSLVVAVGHPFGVRGALSTGIVHAMGSLVPGGRSWTLALAIPVSDVTRFVRGAG